MVWRLSNGVHDLINKGEGHVLVKQIAHGADKYGVWFFPCEGLRQGFFMQGQLEAVQVFRLIHGL